MHIAESDTGAWASLRPHIWGVHPPPPPVADQLPPLPEYTYAPVALRSSLGAEGALGGGGGEMLAQGSVICRLEQL